MTFADFLTVNSPCSYIPYNVSC